MDEIAARLRAGDLAPREAVDALIELSLDAEIGPQSEALRAHIRRVLEDLVETDPGLADKLATLDGFMGKEPGR